MATLEVLRSDCHETNCKARATRRVRKDDGTIDGDYCARHGNTRLVELGKLEGAGRNA
jgi:hypothetical protein